MGPLIQALGQVGQWFLRNPRMIWAVSKLAQEGARYYRNLSPEYKAKVDAAIRWGVKEATKYALSSVLGDVGRQVVASVSNEQVAEFAKAVVTRGVSVGVETALAEAHKA